MPVCNSLIYFFLFLRIYIYYLVGLCITPKLNSIVSVGLFIYNDFYSSCWPLYYSYNDFYFSCRALYHGESDPVRSLPDRPLQLTPQLVLRAGRGRGCPRAHCRGPDDRQQLHHTLITSTGDMLIIHGVWAKGR